MRALCSGERYRNLLRRSSRTRAIDGARLLHDEPRTRGEPVLEAGVAVPDVGADDQDGHPVRLRGFAGRKLVVYFYPKADTPGCTRESQAFRDIKGELDEAGAAIGGVSRDAVAP